MTIAIKTRLHSGIYRSDGGGKTKTHYEFAVGPRNLIKALRLFVTHKEQMLESYESVGCGRSWIEINGIELDWFDYDSALTMRQAHQLISRYSNKQETEK